ncbi:uncharacterized protein [Physcomitrium patens]|uniref:Uncharacterized protein n=1 Tax=Physcomitrium patens TaxID=3218 RepID=A9SDH9_PHYPA|nr:protein FAM133A-like [Physcomitrium patens]PNR36592.1 hypothetical protein PHYPA_022443 [Physcomitrium patens]|eukprot:XP_024400007.1 protein FAM133A-like [Physcomitrella patens]
MNPDTERRLAALIMEEAKMMRQRAETDGVSAYLAKPVVKARPNRQFLSAMVRSVQHANRIVDMEEMWRQRDLENNARRDKSSRETRDERFEVRSADRDYHAERMNLNEEGSDTSSSDQDDGLKDEDIEKFLHSRVKRGRGAVGSRMDEPGPYCARSAGPASDTRQQEEWEERVASRPVAGPSILPERLPAADADGHSRRDSKKHKNGKSKRVHSSNSDDGEVRDRKRHRESKDRKRKERRKSKDSDKHSKKEKRRR